MELPEKCLNHVIKRSASALHQTLYTDIGSKMKQIDSNWVQSEYKNDVDIPEPILFVIQ